MKSQLNHQSFIWIHFFSGRFVLWRALESVLFSVERVACGYFCWAGVALDAGVLSAAGLWWWWMLCGGHCALTGLCLSFWVTAPQTWMHVYIYGLLYLFLFLFSVHQFLWMRQVNQCSHCYSLEAMLFLCSTPLQWEFKLEEENI